MAVCFLPVGAALLGHLQWVIQVVAAMARPVPKRAYETQPQLFGAAPNQYRFGSAVGISTCPPC